MSGNEGSKLVTEIVRGINGPKLRESLSPPYPSYLRAHAQCGHRNHRRRSCPYRPHHMHHVRSLSCADHRTVCYPCDRAGAISVGGHLIWRNSTLVPCSRTSHNEPWRARARKRSAVRSERAMMVNAGLTLSELGKTELSMT